MPRTRPVILAALVAAMVLPGTVIAARAERVTETFTELYCADLRSASGNAHVSAWITDGGETYADLTFWAAPAEPWESAPTWNGYANAALINGDGTSLEITFGVYVAPDEATEDEPVEPMLVGEATLSATLARNGEAQTFGYRDRYGNHQFRSEGTWQPLSVSGDLVLPDDIVFELAGCEASRVTQSHFANRPASAVSHEARRLLTCTWSADLGRVDLYAQADSYGTGAGLWIEGDEFYHGYGDATLTRTAFETSFDLYPGSDDPLPPVGHASASAELSTGDRFSDTFEFNDTRSTSKGTWLDADGSVTLELAGGTTPLPIDAEHCLAVNVRWAELPAPNRHVTPPLNDAPAAAVLLGLGDVRTTSTVGAQEAPEAPCLVDDGEGGTWEGPITHTVWWRIDGTGGPLTVDTAGSSFDTMVGVYLAHGAEVGSSLGCVDDIDEGLEARITFDTAANSSYFVQTGGYGGSTGDLTVAVYE